MDRFSVLCLPLFLALATTLDPPSTSKRYRSDYVYNGETDAFYKLHILASSRTRATAFCAAEGARLMSPAVQDDIHQVHRMLKQFPDLGDLVWVGDDGLPHDSVEEHPIIQLDVEEDQGPRSSVRCDVITRRGEVETASCYRWLPFMCKVTAKDAPFDSNCEVYGSDYTYNATVGSCYRVTRIALTWEEGFNECRAQGAHLAVLNSEAERLAVWQAVRKAGHLATSRMSWFYYIGFRTGRGRREFRTIFNQTLEEAGCAAWSPHEPNNGAHRDEDCGSLFDGDGKFNDITCRHQLACICEKEMSNTSGG